MKNLKYVLMLGCALSALPASAKFKVNDPNYFYKWSESNQQYFFNDDINRPYDSGITEISSVYGEDADDIKFEANSVKISEGATFRTTKNPTLVFGNENAAPTIISYGLGEYSNSAVADTIEWENNKAHMKFVGDVYAKINGDQTLFKTEGDVNGNLKLMVANGTGNANVKVQSIDSDKVILNNNALYNIGVADTQASGKANKDYTTTTYAVTQKTAAEMTDYTADQAGLLLKMMNTAEGTNETYDNMTTLAQLGGNEGEVRGFLNTMLNPTQASNEATMNVAKEIANLTMARMAGIAGGEEAEDSINFIPWIQGMFNHTNNTQGDGFTANIKGISLGVDAEINNAWMVGAGYSNVNSRIKTDASSTRGYGDNGFVYAQYKPSDWYVRGMAGYGRTTYKDQKNGTKWDVDAYTANAFAGYIWGILDTSIGARYTYLDNKSYKAGDATISADDTDNLTAVVDFKVSQEYAAKDWMVTPSAHVGFTYDVISADNASTVALGAGYGSYEVNGERLHKAGVEAGTGVVFKNGNSEFHLNYEGAFRKDNYSNGGFVKFKYNF